MCFWHHFPPLLLNKPGWMRCQKRRRSAKYQAMYPRFGWWFFSLTKSGADDNDSERNDVRWLDNYIHRYTKSGRIKHFWQFLCIGVVTPSHKKSYVFWMFIRVFSPTMLNKDFPPLPIFSSLERLVARRFFEQSFRNLECLIGKVSKVTLDLPSNLEDHPT